MVNTFNHYKKKLRTYYSSFCFILHKRTYAIKVKIGLTRVFMKWYLLSLSALTVWKMSTRWSRVIFSQTTQQAQKSPLWLAPSTQWTRMGGCLVLESALSVEQFWTISINCISPRRDHGTWQTNGTGVKRAPTCATKPRVWQNRAWLYTPAVNLRGFGNAISRRDATGSQGPCRKIRRGDQFRLQNECRYTLYLRRGLTTSQLLSSGCYFNGWSD